MPICVGSRFLGYLPDTEQGRRVAALFKKAFDLRLTFEMMLDADPLALTEPNDRFAVATGVAAGGGAAGGGAARSSGTRRAGGHARTPLAELYRVSWSNSHGLPIHKTELFADTSEDPYATMFGYPDASYLDDAEACLSDVLQLHARAHHPGGYST